MSYAAGFDAGERDAYQDRENGVRRVFEGQPMGEYQQGYQDGYSPRNPEWIARRTRGQEWIQ